MRPKHRRKLRFATCDNKATSPVRMGFAIAAVVTLALLGVTMLIVRHEYLDALAFVKTHVDELRSAEKTTPIRIHGNSPTVRLNTDAAEVLKHLRQLEYVEREANEPGSFHVAETTISVKARYPEFKSLKLTVRRGRITGIENAASGEALPVADLEPLELGAYLPGNDPRGIGAIVSEPVEYERDIKGSNFEKALLIVENADFFEEANGISWKGMARAFRELVKCTAKKVTGPGCRKLEGGSTITRQLVKNLFLTNDQTFSRKFREFFLTIALERYVRHKTEILELYTNNVTLSDAVLDTSATRRIHGFGALARYLFNKSLRDLDEAEAVALACFARRPSAYLQRDDAGNFINAEKLLDRRNYFLSKLGQQYSDDYTEQAIASAKTKPIELRLDWRQDPLDKAAATYAAMAEREAEKLFRSRGRDFSFGTVRFYTSGDPEALMGMHSLLRERLPAFADQVRAQTQLPDGVGFSGSIVTYDASTGTFLSVNSLDLDNGVLKLSRHAFDSSGQIMSIVKPFVAAHAVSTRKIGLNNQIDASECRAPDGWLPPEREAATRTLAAHLAASSNRAPLCVLEADGVERFNAWWTSLVGRSGPLDYRIANGLTAQANLSAVEVARLWGMFAANGSVRESKTIQRFAVGEETEIMDNPESIDAITPVTARSVSNGLRAVVDRSAPNGELGTARSLVENAGLASKGIRIFGKTGSGPGDFWIALGTVRGIVIVIRLTVRDAANADTSSISAAETAGALAERALPVLEEKHPEWFR